MIETLLNYHADPNIAENEEIGLNSPMHLAVALNMLDVIP